MNIVFIGVSLKKKSGGGLEKNLTTLVNYFSDKNQGRVSVVIMGARAEDEWFIPSTCRIYELKIIRDSRNVVDAVIHNFQINSSVFSAIKEEDPDIIVSFIPDVATVCKIRFPQKCVVGCLRVNPNVYTEHNIKQRLLTYHLSFILDGFIFQTYGAQSMYSQRAIMKSRVIPNGTQKPDHIVDINVLPMRRKIYASGRLAEGKRFDDIIRAFSYIVEDYEEYILVIIGTGDREDYLKEYAADLGIDDRVEFFGTSSDPMVDMIDGYMYVFASDTEGYPNALAEAVMIGLPCIATNCDFGPADIIKDGFNGILVDVGDISAMTDAMRGLIEDPAFAVSLSVNTEAYRKSHSMEGMGEAYYEYFEKLYNDCNQRRIK